MQGARALPTEVPSEVFVQSILRRFRTKFADAGGTMSQEVWKKILQDAQAEVSKKYKASIKKEFLFDSLKQFHQTSGVDLRTVPSTEAGLITRLQEVRDAFAKSGKPANYEHRYEELADTYDALAGVFPAESTGAAAPAVLELESKDEPPSAPSKSAVLGSKFKKFAGSIKGKKAAYIKERDQFQMQMMQNLSGQASAVAERLIRSGVPPSSKVIQDLLAVRTGLDFSKVDMSKSTLGTYAEKMGLMLQDLPLSDKFKGKYKYLGAYRGSLEALFKAETPANQLDAAAAIHDLAYLEASAASDAYTRGILTKYADEDFVRAADSIAAYDPDEQVRADARVASKAITTKSAVEGYVGKFDLSTAGVRKLSRPELVEKTKQLTSEIRAVSEGISDEHVRADLQGYLDEIARIEDTPFVIDPELEPIAKLVDAAEAARAKKLASKKPKAGSLGGVSVPLFPPQAPQPLEPGVAEPQSEVETTGAPGGLEMKSMGLDDVLKSIAKMNASVSPLSITPVTGERNLRPLLVKGDVNDVVRRTQKEIADNRNYYAAWKWVQEGAGNGNQQPLPDQVGMPANNRIWDMQKRNERFKYRDNFDGGAADWYKHKKATLGKYIRTAPVARKKYTIPMYSDNQRHQWPTRNGGLPAGCGRVIKMARDRADGFEIFSPAQVLIAPQTRLFHGDIIESEGRLTRV